MSRFAELASSRIHHDDVGQGEAVLLVHGLGMDLRMWDDQVPALAQRHRVVRLDLHGFGNSSPVSGPFSYSEIIGELLAHLEIDHAHLVGLEEMVRDYSGWFFANAAAGLERRPKVPIAEALKDFELPALVVVGEDDSSDFRDFADEIATRLPGARKVVLEGVGHMCNMEDPATFNRVLLEFLETVT